MSMERQKRLALGASLLRDCTTGIVAVSAVTAVSWWLQDVTGYWTISLIFLLTVLVLALKLNRWATLLTATLSALVWNFLFIPPRFTFHIASAQDTLMFVTYFAVALIIGHLTNQLRMREAAERRRQRRTAALNRLLTGIASSTSLEEGLRGALLEIEFLFGVRATVLVEMDPSSAASDALILPLQTSNASLGVLAVKVPVELTLSERELLETFACQIAALIERYRLIENAQAAQLTVESERLHRALLDSVSHEMKTPLAVIRTAAEGLEAQAKNVPLARTFLDEIQAANRRLRRVVDNLLDITRIETQRVPLDLEWCDVRDLLESAVEQLSNEISPERIELRVPEGLPAVRLDFGLMEQALCNLLVNAARHSPANAPIRLEATLDDDRLALRVTDHGTGLVPGEETKVFDKFYRGSGGGIGLGLSIVKGFVGAHHGEVSAKNQPGGGVTFTIQLPVETAAVPVS
jgi:two-component system sensor histidine kinase KdpD